MLVLFRWLLRLYPARFFGEFSEEMTHCFHRRLQDVRHQSWRNRGSFFAREFSGAFVGAMSEQMGGRFDDLFRRFDMRSFRFSRLALVFMILALVGVLAAIKTTVRTAVMQQPANPGVDVVSILQVSSAMVVVMAILGVVGYAVLRVANKSAGERLANVHTWPQERHPPRG
ncbi:MAG TPA: hypothetical protein VFR05_00090 [Terriglobia bacterium]|nr:hypothetical protein [Terriglobia bacterium]